MEAVDLNMQKLENYVDNISNKKQTVKGAEESAGTNMEQKNSSIHNSAVNVSISMESMKVFLNIKSVELSQANTNAQNSLMNIINNTEIYDFLSGKEIDGGFSLSSIGYEGKPITELSPDEAKDLVSDEGFFGVSKTSERVSSFVINLAGDDVEGLQEARKGIVQGFEEAEKMWGGELPEISYETQEKTLDIIDKKIEELLKTDAQKELEEGNTAKEED
ncbi:MAG: hydrogenase-4 component G [Halarcobacter ebronensis]|uniref:hydrogenase-4 component G n=1 Tax=Halarcobacter ebronensis TaxID=1462615 RepID=UPI003C78579D